jgi:hypothetical protein
MNEFKLRPAIQIVEPERPEIEYPRRDRWLLSRGLLLIGTSIVLFVLALGKVLL